MPTIQEVKNSTLQFLQTQETAVVGTVSKEGIPQVATVYYVIDDDFTFYIVTHLQSSKAKNLRDNNHVALVVGFGPNLKTVQAGGVAEVMEDWRTGTLYRKKVMLHMIEKVERDMKEWPIMRLSRGEEFTVLKIIPQWMTYLNLDESDPLAYREDFYKVLP